MSVFENDRRSNYEELQSYYPVWYKDILEMDAVQQICGRQLDGMAEGMEKAVANRFVSTMDEAAVGRYEAFFGLATNRNRTLEERKKVIKAAMIGSGKLSSGKIEEIIKTFSKGDCIVRLKSGQLYVFMKFTENPSSYLPDIRRLLNKKKPAHLELLYAGVMEDGIWFCLNDLVDIPRITFRMPYGRPGCGLRYEYPAFAGRYSFRLKSRAAASLKNRVLCRNQESARKSMALRIGHTPEETAHAAWKVKVNGVQAGERFPMGLIIKHNLYTFDGSRTFDGTDYFNAFILQEEL